MLKPLFVVFALFLTLPGFAQDEIKKEPLSQDGGQVTIRPSSPDAAIQPEPIIAPAIDEEAIAREAEADRLKQAEKYKKVDLVVQPIVDAQASNPLQEIQKLGYEQINAAALMDDKVIAILQKTMREGAMTKLSDADVKKQIMDKVKGGFGEKFFKRFPKFLSISADVLRDKEALPGLLNIMARKSDLKDYGYIWLAIFVLGLYIKNRLVKPTWKLGRRFKWNLSINLVLSSISLFIFYTFFEVELTPTINIFIKNLF